jgi:hypothetical protein
LILLCLTDGKPLCFSKKSKLCIYQLDKNKKNKKIFVVNLLSENKEAVHIPLVFRSNDLEVCVFCVFVNCGTGVFKNRIFIG